MTALAVFGSAPLSVSRLGGGERLASAHLFLAVASHSFSRLAEMSL